MIYRQIIDTRFRTPEYIRRLVPIPPLTLYEPGTLEHFEWELSHPELFNLSVHKDDLSTARRLALELHQQFDLHKDFHHSDVQKALSNLLALRLPEISPHRADQRWEYGATIMAEYLSPHDSGLVRNIFGTRYSTGNILEAMSGHQSYVLPAPNLHVTALDGCEASLLRYPYPARCRICCDLDQLDGTNKIDSLVDDTFDGVVVCCGYKYPKHILHVLKEFHRILKPGGSVSFIESRVHGFGELVRREGDPLYIKVDLEDAGFREVVVHPVDSRESLDNHSTLFHVQGIVAK